MNCPKCQNRPPCVGDRICASHRSSILGKPVSMLAIAPEQFDDFSFSASNSSEFNVPSNGPLPKSHYANQRWLRSPRFRDWVERRCNIAETDREKDRAFIEEMFAGYQAQSIDEVRTCVVGPRGGTITARQYADSETAHFMLNGGSRRVPKRANLDRGSYDFVESDHDFASLAQD